MRIVGHHQDMRWKHSSARPGPLATIFYFDLQQLSQTKPWRNNKSHTRVYDTSHASTVKGKDEKRHVCKTHIRWFNFHRLACPDQCACVRLTTPLSHRPGSCSTANWIIKATKPQFCIRTLRFSSASPCVCVFVHAVAQLFYQFVTSLVFLHNKSSQPWFTKKREPKPILGAVPCSPKRLAIAFARHFTSNCKIK